MADAVEDVAVPRDDPERKQVRRWRRDEALVAGLSPAEADLFADSATSLSELRACVRNGWTPEQIAAVVL